MIPDTEEHPEWVMCPNCGEILEDEDAEEGELCCRCESELINQGEI